VAEGQPSRGELYRIIERQQAQMAALQTENARLLTRVEELEAELAVLRGSGGVGGSGPLRPPRPARPPRKTGPRRKRPHAFVRARGIATQQVTHAVDRCPDCGCALRGGSVTRHREVIEIALAPATITDHVLVERVCPLCRKRCVPRLGPGEGVVGQHRFGPRLLALIVTLHQVGRMTVRPIQEHLATVFGVHVSIGAIEDALRTVAARGTAEVEAIRDQIRASPVAHADETSWPEDGAWRTFWVVSARRFRYFEIGRRTGEQIDAILGAAFAGILVTDFYAAYHHFGLHQRCWAHILRALHDLLAAYPADRALARWVRRLIRIYQAARDAPPCATPTQRRRHRRHLEQRLQAACLPFATIDVPQRRLSARLLKHLAELFTFVTEPDVAPTNNQAERDLRPCVVARKVSGGTRSPDGSTTIARLATLFRTWRAHDLNPFLQCVNLLSAPQP
jgi:transposase